MISATEDIAAVSFESLTATLMAHRLECHILAWLGLCLVEVLDYLLGF